MRPRYDIRVRSRPEDRWRGDIRAAGLEPVRVEPDEYLSIPEMAERTERTRQSVDALIRGVRGPDGFPPPTYGSGRHALWRWAEVSAWFAVHGYDVFSDRERDATILVVNDALEIHRTLPHLRARDRARVLALAKPPRATGAE